VHAAACRCASLSFYSQEKIHFKAGGVLFHPSIVKEEPHILDGFRPKFKILVPEPEDFVRDTMVLPTLHEKSGIRVDFIR
jgi:hypothetical protein